MTISHLERSPRNAQNRSARWPPSFQASKLRFTLALAGFGVAWLLGGCAAGPRQARLADADAGRAHFESYCAACHAPEGQGLEGGAPPLEDSSWVRGPESRLIKIVLHGVRGTIEVDGKSYDREMPGFGQVLTDADVASLLSYVRRRFGGPSPPVTAEAVSRVRAAHPNRRDYWPVEELLEDR